VVNIIEAGEAAGMPAIVEDDDKDADDMEDNEIVCQLKAIGAVSEMNQRKISATEKALEMAQVRGGWDGLVLLLFFC
jgi:hypothetical protein